MSTLVLFSEKPVSQFGLNLVS